MRVRMLVARVLQEAGRERPLSAGETYEVSDATGADLVACGAAVSLAVTAPPERKPATPPETKRRRS
jgi:hypothetical protein